MRVGTMASALVLSALLGGSTAAAQSDFRVTLLDAGRGARIRLWQLKIPFSEVTPLFLTHFDSDHVSGILDLWQTGWLGGPFGRRKTPFHVIGPVGTKDLMANLERAYAIRRARHMPPPNCVRLTIPWF